MGVFWFLSLIYVMFFVLLYFSVLRDNSPELKQKKVKAKYANAYIFIGIITIISFFVMNNYTGVPLVTGGFKSIITALTGLFSVGENTATYYLFTKIPAILSAAMIAGFIYIYAIENNLSHNKGFVLFSMVLFSPAVMLSSVFFGTPDSIFAALVIYSVLLIIKEKHLLASLILTIASFINPIGIVLLLIFIFILIINPKGQKAVLPAVLIILTSFVILAFAQGGGFARGVLAYIELPQFMSQNAANLFAGFGLVGAATNILVIAVSIILIALALIAAIFFILKSENKDKWWYLFSFIVISVSILSVGQNTFSMYLGVILLIFAYITTKDFRLLILFLLFSLTQFLTGGEVMYYLSTGATTISNNEVTIVLLSWVNLIAYAAFVYTGIDIYLNGKIMDTNWRFSVSKPTKRAPIKYQPSTLLFQRTEEKCKLVRVDIILMASLMLAYGILGFANLGSMNVPETGFSPDAENPSFVVELAKASDVKRIYMFTCWVDRRKDNDVIRDVSLETSADGVTYTPAGKIKIQEVLRWRYDNVNFTNVKFIKFNVTDENRFVLNELVFFGKDETEKFAISGVKDLGGCGPTLSNLIDEQDKALYKFSWYDGSYFDEIYHPRTAYEHLHGLEMYENSHPPLGKLIIGLGMTIFGVTPFGWRFFGVFFAFMMIGLIYTLSKRMFKDSKWAFISAFLLCFDFMTTAQARLATIDTYITFFILAMYYFMYRYYSMSFYDTKLSKTLIPLGLSGLFMGIGIATKWTGFYAAFGLAILFSVVLLKRYREYLHACEDRSASENNGIAYKHVKSVFAKYTTITILFAILFFIVIPAGCYIAAYTPYFNIPKPNHGFDAFMRLQQHMFNYHSGLTATHPFASPWYEWPLDLRPLLYATASSEFTGPGMTYSIVSMGNPLIWWMTIPVFIYSLYLIAKRRATKELTVIMVAFLALYMPWMLITRNIFIYHFFTNTPLLMLWITFTLKYMLDNKLIKMRTIYIYLGLVLVCYIMFYPVLTGMTVPTWYGRDFLKWLPKWQLA